MVVARSRAARALLALLLLAPIAGCGSADQPAGRPAASTAAPAVARLDPAAFAAAVAEPDRVTVNVHVPYEGRIDGTDLFVPFDRVRSDPTLPADRATPLAIYCRTGRMSAEAGAGLVALGYSDVVELAGGMVAWERDGRALRQ